MLELESKIIKVLKNVYDPEIPVNIYDLGMIYSINVDEKKVVKILMTFTAPNCPMADTIVQDIKDGVKAIDGVSDVNVEFTFDPPWDKDMMSDEAKLQLGFL